MWNAFEIAKSAGADRCVDQQTENIKDIVMEMTNGVGADKCFECSGAVPAANKALELVRRKGHGCTDGRVPAIAREHLD